LGLLILFFAMPHSFQIFNLGQPFIENGALSTDFGQSDFLGDTDPGSSFLESI